uniref:Uncharacterized protein n=1 Tax=Candidatus Kentrum sp. SD TaxID=2126332 RepID=A0A451BJ63_9GAMM|nr:MAG: hypothetical protein BECKSD772F_GA0070984_100533 [Candidatus Kentron sp. SD]VFK40404.1 MAG: hypothetical protein BECKSD772E_GA0070983_100633 [Candidatus Kentron sp. SD]VFK78340.1 MAG: hypothetical protein BECKSD772D_GA0070982_101217 [Candidatus Kentron sp. SD]
MILFSNPWNQVLRLISSQKKHSILVLRSRFLNGVLGLGIESLRVEEFRLTPLTTMLAPPMVLLIVKTLLTSFQ